MPSEYDLTHFRLVKFISYFAIASSFKSAYPTFPLPSFSNSFLWLLVSTTPTNIQVQQISSHFEQFNERSGGSIRTSSKPLLRFPIRTKIEAPAQSGGSGAEELRPALTNSETTAFKIEDSSSIPPTTKINGRQQPTPSIQSQLSANQQQFDTEKTVQLLLQKLVQNQQTMGSLESPGSRPNTEITGTTTTTTTSSSSVSGTQQVRYFYSSTPRITVDNACQTFLSCLTFTDIIPLRTKDTSVNEFS